MREREREREFMNETQSQPESHCFVLFVELHILFNSFSFFSFILTNNDKKGEANLEKKKKSFVYFVACVQGEEEEEEERRMVHV